MGPALGTVLGELVIGDPDGAELLGEAVGSDAVGVADGRSVGSSQ